MLRHYEALIGRYRRDEFIILIKDAILKEVLDIVNQNQKAV
ncbi:hypothetical protein JFL43_21790 [Viridibacillus sp. YIM B01967]|uniref:GGDEF domain-containing protein n=1 Tax=Viridibacillus soli TaxID=2798301 RepID=A0ABS1HD57_9BACL|nr:hypothetical protein [Viridibacillus soli]